MARINLLPWRESARKQREIEFYILLGLAAVGCILFLLYLHMRIGVQIDTQSRRNDFLAGQIALVDKDIGEIKNLEKDKDKLLSRMAIIQQLQTSRSAVVHLAETLVRTLPEGTRFLKIGLQGNAVELVGVADSHGRVSTFMRNLEKSGWVSSPELDEINDNVKEFPGMYWFSLRATYVPNYAPPAAGAGAGSAEL
ncbi:MAG: PilN domain-containing protein [Gammaproteobacteria bacterium]|nr:PilN domain-containing protein [Gammaproteobacteria bacterium]